MASRGVSLAALTHSDVHSLMSVITMRLGERNFIKWSFQFQLTLAGNGLFGYFDGTEVAPPRYVLNTEGEVVNEETAAYKAWKQTDMALMSLLIATLDEDIIDVIIGYKTSRQAWLALQEHFSAVSRVSIIQLKTELQTIRKGSECIAKYLQRVKSARDQLLYAGVTIPDEDIIIVVLNGLPEEYSIVRTVIEGRETQITLRDLRSQLLAAERRIEGSFSLHSNMSAMVARGDGARFGGRDEDNRNWSTKNDGKGKDVKYSAGGAIECQVCGKRGHTVDTCFRVHKCQICGKHGHLTSTCYQNPEYKPLSSSQSSQSRSLSSGPSPECQICSKKGHTAANCFYRTDVPAGHPSLSIPSCQICGLKGHVALNCTHRTNFAYQGSKPPTSLTALTKNIAHSTSLSPSSFTTLLPRMSFLHSTVPLCENSIELEGDNAIGSVHTSSTSNSVNGVDISDHVVDHVVGTSGSSTPATDSDHSNSNVVAIDQHGDMSGVETNECGEQTDVNALVNDVSGGESGIVLNLNEVRNQNEDTVVVGNTDANHEELVSDVILSGLNASEWNALQFGGNIDAGENLSDVFLDSFLILWIFISLSKTLEQLQAKRSYVKLHMYRKFSNALAVTVIVSVAWIAYEVYFKATDSFNEKWHSAWIITAFWDIFALLCVICYFWAPSQNSQRYAYSENLGEKFDDEESQTLTGGKPEGDISLVKQEEKIARSNGDSDEVSINELVDNDEQDVESGKLAGLILKNALDAKGQHRKFELGQRWIALDPTVKAMKEDEEPVTLQAQAVEFWSSFCDEEIDILEEYGGEFTGDFVIPCFYLIPLLLETLLKQEEDQDQDEGAWNIAMACGI